MMKSFKGGGSLVSRPPVFSNDGLKILVCTGAAVSIFSVQTSLLIVELTGHKAQVTGVVVVADEHVHNCWTSSMDCTIRLWGFHSGSCLKVVQASWPVEYLAIPQSTSVEKCDVFAFLSVRHNDRPSWCGRTLVHNLSQGKEVFYLEKTFRPRPMVASPSGKLVGTADRHKLFIWKPKEGKIHSSKEIKFISLHHTKELCTLAFHPSDSIVAGGDVTGRILIWREVGAHTFAEDTNVDGHITSLKPKLGNVRKGYDDSSSLTTWHWHQFEVHFLSFSSDGSYLYSGGKEGALVIWQIETGKKNFFPRLGGPLLYLAQSPEPAFFSISCSDNRILFINIGSMEIQKSIDGIKLPITMTKDIQHLQSVRATVDYKAGILLLPSDNHSVQFYDVYHDQAVFEVKVSQRNYIFAYNLSELVTLVAIAATGLVMGTVEFKQPEANVGGDVTLKFWNVEARNRRSNLSTVIFEPHGEAEISSLIFHPQKYMAVSCSYSGNFKVWVASESKQQSEENGWKCQSIGSYKQKPMLCAAYSPDGSLLAVGAGDLVTLWNPETNALISVIGEAISGNAKNSFSQAIAGISSMHFVSKLPYLVTVDGPMSRLSVRNLSTLSIWWSYELSVEAVASDPHLPNFIVLAHFPATVHDKLKGEDDAVLILFNVENPSPIAVWIVRKGRGGAVFFIQKSSVVEGVDDLNTNDSVVVFLNRDHEYAILDPEDDQSLIKPLSKVSEAKDEDTGSSGSKLVFSKALLMECNTDRESAKIPDNHTPNHATAQKLWEKLFDGPSHVLPPLTRIGIPFFESFLEKRKSISN